MPAPIITRKSKQLAKQYSLARCEELLREDPRGVDRLMKWLNQGRLGKWRDEMTKKQQDLAQRAIGLPNHDVIIKGGDGYEEWEYLVSKGMARKGVAVVTATGCPAEVSKSSRVMCSFVRITAKKRGARG